MWFRWQHLRTFKYIITIERTIEINPLAAGFAWELVPCRVGDEVQRQSIPFSRLEPSDRKQVLPPGERSIPPGVPVVAQKVTL
jgi:hypothetical protein